MIGVKRIYRILISPAIAAFAAAVATTTAAGIFRAGARLVDDNGAVLERFTVHSRDGSICLGFGRHFYERESAGTPAESVRRYCYGINFAERAEFCGEFVFSGLVREIANIDLHLSVSFLVTGTLEP